MYSISLLIGLLVFVGAPDFTRVQCQDYRKFNMSGMHAFRGPIPNKNVKLLTTFGRGFLASFNHSDCVSDRLCRDGAVAITTKIGDCMAHTFYEGLGMMGMVCFGPPSFSSAESDKSTLATLHSLPLLQEIVPDKRVRLRLPQTAANSTADVSITVSEMEGNNRRRKRGSSPRRPNGPSQNDLQEAHEMATPYNWGRDRMNQVDSTLDGHSGTCASKGAGVRVYVLDTGCRTSHVEFRTCLACRTSRATTESVLLSSGYRPYGIGIDNNGHGTHVAAYAGGLRVGMAPSATVKCIKVLGGDGGGTLSDIMSGFDMVARAKRASPGTPIVVNLSLGSSYSGAVNSAVSRLVSLGVIVVVAAGNEAQDASRVSPASSTSAVTVGASSTSDRRASWSNYGSVVDLYAPGVDILSASNRGDAYYVQMSGTSMASPGVAGQVACILGNSLRTRCSSNAVVGELRNPVVSIRQPGGNRPLTYLAAGSSIACS